MSPATTKSGDSGLPGADHYAALLAEAQGIKGVSLWHDAWRRLRRNRTAMVSLTFLSVVSFLAFLTPLWPLQSPLDQDLKNRQLLLPGIHAQHLGQREGLKFKNNSLTEELRVYSAKWHVYAEELRVFELGLAEMKKREVREPSPESAARLEAKEKERPLPPQDPFDRLWNKPGLVARALIHARLAVFGDWCVPSLCGTDNLGRDVLARLFWGARVSLIVGVVATFVSLLIGVSYGATAGFLGGWIDNLMMRFVDVLYSVPFIFVVIFLITILSEDSIKNWLDQHYINQIVIFYFVIGAIYWLTMSRVVRGQVISLKNEQFVDAARTIGASRSRIIFRHLIPNVMGVVIVYLSLTIPSVMLFEALLSFLGLGVRPPDVSWGLLVNDGILVITKVRIVWWLVLFPGLTLALTLFALNFLGDGLRDALDPRMKNR